MHRISSSVWNIEISTLHSYGKSGFVCLIKCSCERFQNLPKKQKKTLSVVLRFFWFSLLNFHSPEVWQKKHLAETFHQTCTSNFWRVPTYPLLADCTFPPSETPLWTWMLTPFITAYPSEVTSKNALYQVRFSLTPAAATVLPVSVALSLPPFWS